MNTDKIVFGIIGAITLGVFAFIIFSSLGTGTPTANAQDLIGKDPHIKVNETAQVTIVEFSDFECPACQSFSSIVRSIIDNNPDQVNVVYRHFPLPSHPNALNAAKASEAAANQGRFWDYHDELFINTPDLSKEDLVRYAGDLGLNVEQFESDMGSSDVADRVKEDLEYGQFLKINSTPTFYLVYGDEYEKVNITSYNDLELRVNAILAELQGEVPASDEGDGADGVGNDLLDLLEGDEVDGTGQAGENDQGPFNREESSPTADDNASSEASTDENLSPVEMQVKLDVLNNQDLDVTPSEVTVQSVEPETWSDSSLGCPQDGAMYAQVITPGFKVTVDAGGETLIYHTNESGDQVILCEN